MRKQSRFVVMRWAPEAVGEWTRHCDWDQSEYKGQVYCDEADGMNLALWSRDKYEEWYGSEIAPQYHD